MLSRLLQQIKLAIVYKRLMYGICISSLALLMSVIYASEQVWNY